MQCVVKVSGLSQILGPEGSQALVCPDFGWDGPELVLALRVEIAIWLC